MPLERINESFDLIHHGKSIRPGIDFYKRRVNEKLTPLLRLRYQNAIADAVADLGSADQIRKVFVGFQRYLYQTPGSRATFHGTQNAIGA